MHTHTCAHSPGVSVGTPVSRPLLLRGALGLTRPSHYSPNTPLGQGGLLGGGVAEPQGPSFSITSSPVPTRDVMPLHQYRPHAPGLGTRGRWVNCRQAPALAEDVGF